MQPQIYIGLDLLDKVFEFTAMTPEKENWNEKALMSNPPRLIRFRQIQSLAQAFLMKEEKQTFLDKAKTLIGSKNTKTILIQSILTGDFIRNRTVADYEEVFSLMKNVVLESENTISNDRAATLTDLIMPYQQLVRYKQQLIGLLAFNSGWLEAGSIFARFSIYLTNSITQNLVDKYEKLDEALELFVNPAKLSFTEAELIAKYNFPAENLRDLDMEYY